MPTYAYKCKKCGKEFEAMQSIKAEAYKNCREAGFQCEDGQPGEIFRKISGNVGLIFNGTGFYLTDYANKKSSAASRDTAASTESSGNGSPCAACAPADK